MRIVTFADGGSVPRLGLLDERGCVLDVQAALVAAGRHGEADRLAASCGPHWWLGDSGRELLLEVGLAAARSAETHLPMDSIRLLPPVPRPGKILAVGRNYASHLEEGRRLWADRGRAIDRPPFPSGFVKVASALAAHGEPIVIPAGVSTVDYEIELAVVIGRRALEVSVDEAMRHVAGYTVANDVAAREIQIPEMEQLGLLVSKNFPTFAPMGPWLVTADEIPDPQALRMTLRVNDDVRQAASTADMLFSVAEVVSAWSRIGLEPGDMILTGTPSGVALSRPEPAEFYLRPGDLVSADIEGIGTLENRVVGGTGPGTAEALYSCSGRSR